MYLQLSENGNGNSNQVDNANPYVFIPDVTGQTKGFYVREDNFDDLDDADWRALMIQVAPYQPQVQRGMSEDYFLSNRASRKAKRAEKQAQKKSKKDAKNAIRNAKAVSIARGDRKDMVSNIVGGLTNLVGQVTGKGGAPSDTTDVENAPGSPAPSDGGGNEPELTFWEKYGTPIKIVGGLLVVGGIAYAVNKKRKRKS